jgi:hypothetical protein
MTGASSSSDRRLVCPSCGARRPADERFCPDCAVPLTYAGADAVDEPVDEGHRRARLIKPQLAEGALVKVAGARNQVEAEFVQALLLEEGVPSTLRRARGFDVPDFLAAGPRDVMVPQSGVGVAREVLLQSEMGTMLPGAGIDAPWRVLAGVIGAFVLVALIAWAGTELLG